MSEVTEDTNTNNNMQSIELGKRVRSIVLTADEDSNASIWLQCSALFSEQSAKAIGSVRTKRAPVVRRKKAAAANTTNTTAKKANAKPAAATTTRKRRSNKENNEPATKKKKVASAVAAAAVSSQDEDGELEEWAAHMSSQRAA
jgi:hypothetical protein